jgi:two-component system chemotaxis response regulator CheY
MGGRRSKQKQPDFKNMPPADHAPAFRALRRVRALVADDSSVMQHVLRAILQKLGVPEVHVAGNGMQALDLLKANAAINVVFADLKMPKLSGMGLLDMLRGSEIFKELPVVIISSEGGTDSILEAGRHGATAYLVKPFSLEKVAGALRKIFPEEPA